MKNNMEEIDQLIKNTLSQEEAAFFDSLEPQNTIGMFMELFKKKNAWFLIITNFMTFIFLGLLVYTSIKFFDVESTNELIKWGLGSIFFLINICMLKVYAWMQMDKNAIVREMKRLELLIISPSGKGTH